MFVVLQSMYAKVIDTEAEANALVDEWRAQTIETPATGIDETIYIAEFKPAWAPPGRRRRSKRVSVAMWG